MADAPPDLITIYTDGACSGNPGPGGWGALLRWREHEKELCGGEANTTNNRMELLAAIMALESLKKSAHVLLYTDSKYVQQGITQWLASWQTRGWRTADKKPVKNQDLWERLAIQQQRHSISFHWVKGHAGHPENERADQLANKGMAEFKRKFDTDS